jgi:hypothetical protein
MGGDRSSGPLSFTCRVSTASAGISRSSGNKHKFSYSFILLLLFIKRRQRFAPGHLLLIVDLAEIENGSLHRFPGRDSLVFYDTEVAMIFAVFFAIVAV